MTSSIVILVLLAIVTLLFAVIVIAHRKQADALGILTAMSATLLAWLAFMRSNPDAPKPTVPQDKP